MEKKLKPVRTRKEDYDEIEKRLKKHFRTQIYEPVMKELREVMKKQKTARMENEDNPLLKAIKTGRIQHRRGYLYGKFSANITKEIKRLGGTWSREQKGFRLPSAELTKELKDAVQASEEAYKLTAATIDKKLQSVLPEEIAKSFKVQDLVKTTLGNMNKDFKESLKDITVQPDLDESQIENIAADYNDNMQKWIRDWTSDEIRDLRSQVQKQVHMGKRYKELSKVIEKSYGTSQSKAEFLARQETNLYMAKVKEEKFKKTGVNEYIWATVAGSAKSPVRDSHSVLDGKKFTWDNPPVTTGPGEPVRRNNPGEDYNCRCYAIPIVKF